MTLTRLTLIRHGQTEWNVRGMWQGHAPTPLNDIGYQQAQAAAPYLATAGIKRIISSDLLRASQTARAINEILHLPLSYDMNWREVDVGNWQGLNNAEIRLWDADKRLAFDAETYINRQFPDGESTRQHINRTAAAMATITQQYPGEHVLAVTHGGSVRCAIYHITGEAIRLSGNCSITRLIFDAEANNWSVLSIAEDASAVIWGN